jgi:hypothetical protein
VKGLATITHVALQENIKVAGIEVTYDTPNGSVIVATHSVSPNRNQVYRVPMWDPLQQKSPTGGYPWRIEPTSTTKVYIKNITDQEEDYVAFLLWQNGGEYMIGLKAIKPHQSIEIDVKKLRDDQTTDERGRIIPLNINFGQLQWTLRRKDTLPDDDAKGNLALIGRSEQIDFVKNTSSNYACQNCCSGDFHNGYIEAADLSQNGPITAGTSRVYFAVEERETCYGGVFGFYEPSAIYNATWATNNSNIATVSGGLVTGINQGDATITASWQPKTSYVTPCGPPTQLVNPDGTLCNEKDEIFPSIKPIKEDEPIITTNLAACGSCVSRRFNYTAYKYVSVVPNIRVTPLEVIGKNSTKQVFVTAIGTNNQPVTLTIQATTGTGEAKFTSNNSTTMTITQSQNVEIKGITESSQKDNLKITASFGNITSMDNFSVATVKIMRTVQNTVGTPTETDVTDAKTKTIVGERQDLKATLVPADLTVTSHLWTIPDTAIKDFVVSDTSRIPQTGQVLPLVILNTASANFVWVDGNVGTTNKQVNYKAVIDGVNITASSGFNVTRPTVTVTSVGGTTMVNNTNPELFLGGAGGSPGISVTASSPVIPIGFTGQFHFVQLISGTTIRRVLNGITVTTQLGGLDGCYPYALNTTQIEDSPGASLTGVTMTGTPFSLDLVDYNAQWTVFYMFKPSGANSSWVPIKKLNWNWHGTATLVTGSNPLQWTPNNINPPGNPVGSDTTDYPTWTQIQRDAAGCNN